MLIRTSCLFFLYLLLVACGTSGVRISFSTSPKPISFKVELAQTSAEREKGLMSRKSLDQDAGMLFIFPSEGDHGFFMKNTLIPLDMIFMDSQKKIIGIIAGTTPNSLEIRSIQKPSRYVLEINAGLAQKNGLKIGTQASWSL